MNLPEPVLSSLSHLAQCGYAAFLVGGCVRDLIMGLEPNDYDIATNATPEQVLSVFHDQKTIKTGLKHGTITVIMDHLPIEITTFRIEGSYTDRRHPDHVTFSPRIEDDLSRRDFTINAMALQIPHPENHPPVDFTCLIDPFNGQRDLEKRCLRCVGKPELRFSEDALRILRAMRFASTLSFHIEERTAQAMHQQKDLLTQIAPERLLIEWKQIICGTHAPHVVRAFWDVLSVLVPELAKQEAFISRSATLKEHTIRVLEHVPKTVSMRLAALLHDIAKPFSSEPGNGTEPISGHAEMGARMTADILNRLRCDRFIRDRVVHLVRFHHQRPEPSATSVKQWLRRHPEPMASDLLLLQKADSLASQPEESSDDLTQIEQIIELVERVRKERQCHTLQDLVVNGDDLVNMGLKPGRRVGALLDYLLDLVIEGRLSNEKEALLRFARKKIDHWTDHSEDR